MHCLRQIAESPNERRTESGLNRVMMKAAREGVWRTRRRRCAEKGWMCSSVCARVKRGGTEGFAESRENEKQLGRMDAKLGSGSRRRRQGTGSTDTAESQQAMHWHEPIGLSPGTLELQGWQRKDWPHLRRDTAARILICVVCWRAKPWRVRRRRHVHHDHIRTTNVCGSAGCGWIWARALIGW